MANTIGTAYINIAPNMQGIQGKIAGGLKGSGSAFADQFGGEISGKSAVIIGAIAGIAQAGVTKAMSLVTNSIGNAIQRVDTLNAAQRTFQYMGFAAADSATAVKAVTASIQGLPTPLDGAIRGMTALAATYGDVKLGQKMFTALNDAVLGFGGSADMVTNAVQQISQLPMDGPLDAQTWNSLRNSGLTPVLVAMGKDMGKSVSQLKSDFGDGTLKVQDFVNELTKMDKQGGGGLTNLHDIAMNATSGIGTGFANMQTAVTRGLANIIQAIGQKNISTAIAQIGKAFEKVLDIVAKDIPIAVGYIKDMVGFVDRNKDVFIPLAVGAAAAATAMLGLAIAAKIAAGVAAMTKAIEAAKLAMFTYSAATAQGAGAMQAFNLAFDANPISIIIVTLAAVTAALVYFFTRTETGRKIFGDFTAWLSGLWSGVKSAIKVVADFLGTAWTDSVGAVTTAFDAVRSVAETVFNAIAGFIEKHKKGLTDIAIVITAIVLPKIIAIGIQAGIAAAQAVAAFAVMAAGAVANAAVSTAAWVVSAAQSVAAFVVRIPGMVAQFAIASAQSVIHAAIATGVWVAGAARMAVRWAISFGIYLAGVAASAAATLLAGAQMALAWLLALGPIGLIVAAVAAAVGLIIANWDTVKGFVSGVWQWIQGAVSATIDWISQHWPLLLAILTGPIGLVVLFISSHFEQIKSAAGNAIGSVIGFFGGLPGRIIGAIGNMGSLLYNSGRDLINGLINGAESLLSKIGEMFLNVIPNWIKTPFKKALGIHSPSTVFAEFGGNITTGLVNGITAQADSVKAAVGTLSDSAVAGMTNNPLAAQFTAQATTPTPAASSTVAGPNGAQQGTDGPAVVQNNSIYNQVDLNTVTRELAWQIRR